MVTPPAFITPSPSKISPEGCISIVGMAGAGKTTIGKEIATLLNWAHLDTDHVIEATYGAPLQHITDSMSKDTFLDLESAVIQRLNVRRAVISTGGSAVYRPESIRHLQRLGPIIYIAVPLEIILERIARKPERGLAIAPGQTVEDLYYERATLYAAAATFIVQGGSAPAQSYAREAAEWLEATE